MVKPLSFGLGTDVRNCPASSYGGQVRLEREAINVPATVGTNVLMTAVAKQRRYFHTDAAGVHGDRAKLSP